VLGLRRDAISRLVLFVLGWLAELNERREGRSTIRPVEEGGYDLEDLEFFGVGAV